MSLVAEKPLVKAPPEANNMTDSPQPQIGLRAYSVAVVAGLLLLDVFGGASYAAAATLLALGAFGVVAVRSRARSELIHLTIDRADLVVIGITYVVVVALYRIAFTVVDGNDIMLFLFFALGLIVGVGSPVIYTVWSRRRTLATLGLSTANLPRVALLAVIFAAVQFSVTFWGYNDLPPAQDVITLGAMAMVVGIFEAVFFRGFVQGRLRESLGVGPAVFVTAILYGIYHLGYGMGPEEIVFLSGLGVIYALAYATVENVLIMWPLLTPLGSLFAQFEGGELVGRLPWAALLGWGDVLAVMITILWVARKHERKLRTAGALVVAARP